MFKTVELPGRVAHLHPGLPDVDADHLPEPATHPAVPGQSGRGVGLVMVGSAVLQLAGPTLTINTGFPARRAVSSSRWKYRLLCSLCSEAGLVTT